MLFEKWKLALLFLERIRALRQGNKHFERKNWLQTKIYLIIECIVSDINSCIKELDDFFNVDLPYLVIEDRTNPSIPKDPAIYDIDEKNVDKENLSILASRELMLDNIERLKKNRGMYRVHTHEWIGFSDVNLVINAEDDLFDRFIARFRHTRELD